MSSGIRVNVMLYLKCSKPSLSGVAAAGWRGGGSAISVTLTSRTSHSLVYASKIYLQEIFCILSNFVFITERLSESKIINCNILIHCKENANWLSIKGRELHSSSWKTRAV